MLGFRALQAIMDLRATAGRQPQSAIRGIADRIPPSDRDRGANEQALARIILRQGARLEGAADFPLLDALQIAASQPDSDPAAFACATAILLADRIQEGLGADDLGSYWDAFRTVFFGLEAHDRAAIIQGFLAGARLGRVSLGPPLPTIAHLTRTEEQVRAGLLALARSDGAVLPAAVSEALGDQMALLVLPHLRMLLAGVTQEPLTGDSPLFEPLLYLASSPSHPASVAATALLLAEAVRSLDAEGWFAVTLWNDRVRGWMDLGPGAGRPILAGLRYLYEADPDWTPMPDRMVSPLHMEGVSLLPVLDASYSGGEPGARVG